MFKNDALKTARLNANLTQNEMASALRVSERTYQRYEAGQTQPSLKTLHAMANTLHVSVTDLADNVPAAAVVPVPVPDSKTPASNINPTIENLANYIIETFGPQHQAVILIEEMSELTKVLCKIQRGKFDRGKLNEEFSHVQVSCEVIRRIMAIKNEDVTEQVRLKLLEYAQA